MTSMSCIWGLSFLISASIIAKSGLASGQKMPWDIPRAKFSCETYRVFYGNYFYLSIYDPPTIKTLEYYSLPLGEPDSVATRIYVKNDRVTERLSTLVIKPGDHGLTFMSVPPSSFYFNATLFIQVYTRTFSNDIWVRGAVVFKYLNYRGYSSPCISLAWRELKNPTPRALVTSGIYSGVRSEEIPLVTAMHRLGVCIDVGIKNVRSVAIEALFDIMPHTSIVVHHVVSEFGDREIIYNNTYDTAIIRSSVVTNVLLRHASGNRVNMTWIVTVPSHKTFLNIRIFRAGTPTVIRTYITNPEVDYRYKNTPCEDHIISISIGTGRRVRDTREILREVPIFDPPKHRPAVAVTTKKPRVQTTPQRRDPFFVPDPPYIQCERYSISTLNNVYFLPANDSNILNIEMRTLALGEANPVLSLVFSLNETYSSQRWSEILYRFNYDINRHVIYTNLSSFYNNTLFVQTIRYRTGRVHTSFFVVSVYTTPTNGPSWRCEPSVIAVCKNISRYYQVTGRIYSGITQQDIPEVNQMQQAGRCFSVNGQTNTFSTPTLTVNWNDNNILIRLSYSNVPTTTVSYERSRTTAKFSAIELLIQITPDTEIVITKINGSFYDRRVVYSFTAGSITSSSDIIVVLVRMVNPSTTKLIIVWAVNPEDKYLYVKGFWNNAVQLTELYAIDYLTNSAPIQNFTCTNQLRDIAVGTGRRPRRDSEIFWFPTTTPAAVTTFTTSTTEEPPIEHTSALATDKLSDPTSFTPSDVPNFSISDVTDSDAVTSSFSPHTLSIDTMTTPTYATYSHYETLSTSAANSIPSTSSRDSRTISVSPAGKSDVTSQAFPTSVPSARTSESFTFSSSHSPLRNPTSSLVTPASIPADSYDRTSLIPSSRDSITTPRALFTSSPLVSSGTSSLSTSQIHANPSQRSVAVTPNIPVQSPVTPSPHWSTTSAASRVSLHPTREGTASATYRTSDIHADNSYITSPDLNTPRPADVNPSVTSFTKATASDNARMHTSLITESSTTSRASPRPPSDISPSSISYNPSTTASVSSHSVGQPSNMHTTSYTSNIPHQAGISPGVTYALSSTLSKQGLASSTSVPPSATSPGHASTTSHAPPPSRSTSLQHPGHSPRTPNTELHPSPSPTPSSAYSIHSLASTPASNNQPPTARVSIISTKTSSPLSSAALTTSRGMVSLSTLSDNSPQSPFTSHVTISSSRQPSNSSTSSSVSHATKPPRVDVSQSQYHPILSPTAPLHPSPSHRSTYVPITSASRSHVTSYPDIPSHATFSPTPHLTPAVSDSVSRSPDSLFTANAAGSKNTVRVSTHSSVSGPFYSFSSSTTALPLPGSSSVSRSTTAASRPTQLYTYSVLSAQTRNHDRPTTPSASPHSLASTSLTTQNAILSQSVSRARPLFSSTSQFSRKNHPSPSASATLSPSDVPPSSVFRLTTPSRRSDPTLGTVPSRLTSSASSYHDFASTHRSRPQYTPSPYSPSASFKTTSISSPQLSGRPDSTINSFLPSSHPKSVSSTPTTRSLMSSSTASSSPSSGASSFSASSDVPSSASRPASASSPQTQNPLVPHPSTSAPVSPGSYFPVAATSPANKRVTSSKISSRVNEDGITTPPRISNFYVVTTTRRSNNDHNTNPNVGPIPTSSSGTANPQISDSGFARDSDKITHAVDAAITTGVAMAGSSNSLSPVDAAATTSSATHKMESITSMKTTPLHTTTLNPNSINSAKRGLSSTTMSSMPSHETPGSLTTGSFRDGVVKPTEVTTKSSSVHDTTPARGIRTEHGTPRVSIGDTSRSVRVSTTTTSSRDKSVAHVSAGQNPSRPASIDPSRVSDAPVLQSWTPTTLSQASRDAFVPAGSSSASTSPSGSMRASLTSPPGVHPRTPSASTSAPLLSSTRAEHGLAPTTSPRISHDLSRPLTGPTPRIEKSSDQTAILTDATPSRSSHAVSTRSASIGSSLTTPRVHATPTTSHTSSINKHPTAVTTSHRSDASSSSKAVATTVENAPTEETDVHRSGEPTHVYSPQESDDQLTTIPGVDAGTARVYTVSHLPGESVSGRVPYLQSSATPDGDLGYGTPDGKLNVTSDDGHPSVQIPTHSNTWITNIPVNPRPRNNATYFTTTALQSSAVIDADATTRVTTKVIEPRNDVTEDQIDSAYNTDPFFNSSYIDTSRLQFEPIVPDASDDGFFWVDEILNKSKSTDQHAKLISIKVTSITAWSNGTVSASCDAVVRLASSVVFSWLSNNKPVSDINIAPTTYGPVQNGYSVQTSNITFPSDPKNRLVKARCIACVDRNTNTGYCLAADATTLFDEPSRIFLTFDIFENIVVCQTSSNVNVDFRWFVNGTLVTSNIRPRTYKLHGETRMIYVSVLPLRLVSFPSTVDENMFTCEATTSNGHVLKISRRLAHELVDAWMNIIQPQFVSS